MIKLPSEFQLTYSADAIAARIKELSIEITVWIKDAEKRTGMPVAAVCVLRGAVFFFTDLLRAFPVSVEPFFCRTRAYSDDSQQLDEVEVDVDDLDVTGRAILLVDEICDTGATLRKLQEVFILNGAKEIHAAVAIQRKIDDSKYVPRWAAFIHDGPEWFVGYGMDSENRFRNLPAMYRIVK